MDLSNADVNREYRSRSDTPIHIYRVNSDQEYPVHGAYWTNVDWLPMAWSINGEVVIGAVRNLDIVRELD